MRCAKFLDTGKIGERSLHDQRALHRREVAGEGAEEGITSRPRRRGDDDFAHRVGGVADGQEHASERQKGKGEEGFGFHVGA